MAKLSVEDPNILINPFSSSEDTMLALLEKAQALTQVALHHDMTFHPAKTIYHYLWVLSDVIEALYTAYARFLAHTPENRHPCAERNESKTG